MKKLREIKERVKKQCAICGNGIKVILYKDKTY